MTALSDLTSLKELLRLRNCLHLADAETIDRYNTIVDWAMQTYWFVDVTKLSTPCTSLDSYYTKAVSPIYLNEGTYTFSRVHFGNTFIFSKSSMLELETGIAPNIDDDFKEKCLNVLKLDPCCVLKFSMLCESWILEDAISTIHEPELIFNAAKENNLLVTPILRVKVLKKTLFEELDFKAVYLALSNIAKKDNDLSIHKAESICCSNDNDKSWRKIIDFNKTQYIKVTAFSKIKIGDNLYMPILKTNSGNRIMPKDVNHLVASRVKVGSFVSIKKTPEGLMLSNTVYDQSETRGNALRRILQTFGSNIFVNGKYLSRASTVDTKLLCEKLKLPICHTKEDLINSIKNNKKVSKQLFDKSPMEMTRLCLSYPEKELIELVNNINFETSDGIITRYSLEDTTCLENPTIETLYCNFAQFVTVFNIFATVYNLNSDAD
ncbi:DNA polymerase processivity factor [Pteropox virus]|uniref:DNA polymerase processivity factor n=1 Tax=Pteropox virus TaxID=1873698 RepID=A0A1B1MRN6_9POXV|nr:DNA polymerase processivity factor [Pteropox virus]ANS71200.1 DNA polymerase processivity factor [Pteropox virus]